MRTVQAQRRLLEEQHAAPPPAKATPAIAVGAPGTVTKAVAKTPKPTPPKVPEEVPLPIAVPIVETPKVTSKTEPPKEPVAKPAPVKVATPEPEPEVVVLEQTPVEVKIPVPAPVIEEAPVIETPLVEPVKAEGVFVQEDEPIIAAAEPVTEVTLPAEVPGAAPVETQVVLEETPVETTKTEQDVPAPINKLPVVQNTLPEAPLEKALAPVPQVEKVPVDTADVMVDDFVVTDSLEVIEPKPIELVPGFEKSTGAVWEIFGPGPVMVTSEEREPAIPAEKTIISVAAEKCSDVEDPKSEKCELPCPMQLSAESVQLTSVETSVEAALNGHFVPELSIES